MITEKQKTISEQSVYGDLRIQVGDSIRVANGAFTEYRGEYVRHVEFECKDTTGMLNINKIKPILRPLSDLTKEITHRGYSNDQPFIPLVELERLNAIPVDNTERALRYFDLLHQWHFDTRKLIEKSEAISTEIVNPYEVK